MNNYPNPGKVQNQFECYVALHCAELFFIEFEGWVSQNIICYEIIVWKYKHQIYNFREKKILIKKILFDKDNRIEHRIASLS